MNLSEIFVFGSKIFEIPQRDPISSLPLELSWRIFLYLDDTSLRIVCRANKIWKRIIMAHKTLRKRLNMFELVLKLGSKNLAQYYWNNKKLSKKRLRKKYLPIGERLVDESKQKMNVLINKKRRGDEMAVHIKRFKLY